VNTLARLSRISLFVISAIALLTAAPAGQERPTGQGFSFKTGVDLVNVSVTVTDRSGRFVGGLKREDFVVYEDGKPQEISQFDADRVPVSLGIALDTSGSMIGEKIVAAQAALNRFLVDLLGAQDEVFLYRFDSRPDLVSSWTKDRRAVGQQLGSVKPMGGTAIYDTVAEAIPLAQSGGNKKKALVVISDGNDTSSRLFVQDLKRQIRESEVLVYAVGIDSDEDDQPVRRAPTPPPVRIPFPTPFPGGRGGRWPQPQSGGTGGGGGWRSRSSDHVNAEALREITDDSGGRTEIVRDPRDLDPATASIADELSKQYYLGYASAGRKDGRWHAIRVEIKNRSYRVRARRGYVAN
jgi:Ca-activated chloride channel homolog